MRRVVVFNVSGQKTYPKWTNHFDREPLLSLKFSTHQLSSFHAANSILFTKAQRSVVIVSNIGIAAMVWGVSHASAVWGVSEVIKYYAIPWLCVTHWCTYLSSYPPLLRTSWLTPVRGQSS